MWTPSRLSGTIIAPDNPKAWKGRNPGRWLTFQDVNGLGVSGLGKIDGRGQGWWDISCKRHPQSPGCGKLAPTVLSFIECNQFSISNILIVNSPQTHILVTGCNNVMIDSLSIKSPETSPNTDGIHISHSTGVFVSNTDIGSGDDCVSIGDYTSHIDITDVNCGPGHGVSIGSLGRSGNEVRVENINVNRVNFNKTSNGVRIKTWQDLLTTFLVLCTASLGLGSDMCQEDGSDVFNVLDYEVVGDGIRDDSTVAFLAAWTAACGAVLDTSTLYIPEGSSFLLNPVKFQGPCMSSSIDVQALAFRNCNNLQLSGLTHDNSPRSHTSVVGSTGLTISNLQITVPEDSPNTDGIDISQSSNIQIHDCIIGTGDDCIAMGGGSANINITSVACGPGYRISIGSLGKGGATDMVEEVHVRNCSFTGTMFGARIKSWQYPNHVLSSSCLNAQGTSTAINPVVDCLLP
ncbi:putative polygalacturonase [Camellia lanceoleosa]|uniref:Polygalacturonase n=1 Tax=Camellia lanceoleosa TaxID=1840588 RepID=A0ACC0FBL5_9ERIC|nr:putative polygalacturonase [Camellia lanceoleosa]